MQFETGAKVRFKFTGESGVVVAPLGGGMVQVRLDSDYHSLIPAFIEDLLPYQAAYTPPAHPGIPKAQAPALQVLRSSVASLEPKGAGLVFEPVFDKEGLVLRYRCWWLNDSAFEFLYQVGLFIGDDSLLHQEGKISPWTITELGDIFTDELNDGPEAEVSLRRITTAGPDDELFKIIKIKAKQFVKNFENIPIINASGYFILAFDQFDPIAANPEKAVDNLQQYTKQKVKRHRPAPSNSQRFEPFNVEAFARFEPEIDLHIQALSPGYARLDKGEILRIQLLHFHQFIDKAIRLGAPKVYVIHGIGEGKLKEAIAAELKRIPQVRKFKNEFHHKYGYGATEVIF